MILTRTTVYLNSCQKNNPFLIKNKVDNLVESIIISPIKIERNIIKAFFCGQFDFTLVKCTDSYTSRLSIEVIDTSKNIFSHPAIIDINLNGSLLLITTSDTLA